MSRVMTTNGFSLLCPQVGVSKWSFTPVMLPLTFINCSGWTNSEVDTDMPETSSFPKDGLDKKKPRVTFQSLCWTTGFQCECTADTRYFCKGMSALRNAISLYSSMWIQLCLFKTIVFCLIHSLSSTVRSRWLSRDRCI